MGGGGGGQGADDNLVARWDPECRRGAHFLNMDARNARAQTVEVENDEEFDSMFNGDSGRIEDNNEEMEEGDEEAGPIHKNQILGPAACKLLRKIEEGCEAIIFDHSNSGEAFKIVKSLVHASSLESINAAFDDDTLQSLVYRCEEAENKVSQVVFVQMLTLIHMRVKFERLLVFLLCELDF